MLPRGAGGIIPRAQKAAQERGEAHAFDPRRADSSHGAPPARPSSALGTGSPLPGAMFRALAALAAAGLLAARWGRQPAGHGRWEWSDAEATWVWAWGGQVWLWLTCLPWELYGDENDPDWSPLDATPAPGAWWACDVPGGSPTWHAGGGALRAHPRASVRAAWRRWDAGPDPWAAARRYREADAADWRAAACAAAASSPLPPDAEATVRAFLGAPQRTCWASQAVLEAESNRRARWALTAALAAERLPGPARPLLRGHLGLVS